MKNLKAGFAFFLLCVGSTGAGEPSSSPAPNSAFIDAEGKTHLTRVVPMPSTISDEAQAKLSHPPPSILSSGASLGEQREKMAARQAKDAEACLRVYPAVVAEATIAGVPV